MLDRGRGITLIIANIIATIFGGFGTYQEAVAVVVHLPEEGVMPHAAHVQERVVRLAGLAQNQVDGLVHH
jgi:hypothetical protein